MHFQTNAMVELKDRRADRSGEHASPRVVFGVSPNRVFGRDAEIARGTRRLDDSALPTFRNFFCERP